jgi:FKBP-type peptidyl-prolyl cis-trans isomerase 2
MESEPQAREPMDPVRKVTVLFVAAIMVALGFVVFVAYNGMKSNTANTSEPIVSGNRVTLNYIGTLPDGRVFDTSILSVASNDALYPKSLTFTQKSNDTYVPFEMVAGNYGSGGTIKGFALGVIGMRVNERKIIEVKPENGYAVNQSMIETIPLNETVLATETVTDTMFMSLFGTDPVLMDILPHYKWKWDVQVIKYVAGFVTYRSYPTVGETVYPFGDPNDADSPMGWGCVVESYNPQAYGGIGTISVRHLVSAQDVYYIKGTDVDGTTFILSGYNATAGTFQIHRSNSDTGYNGELAGRTLYFEVTILAVKSS